jgi:F-type H+-transporting ATPase subunit a
MLNFDPLEQFSIELYSSFFNTLVTGSFSSVGLMSIFVFFILLFCYYSVKSVFLLNKFQKSITSLFQFVLGILKDSLSIKKYSFILLFYSTFLFIFISNILGMIPYSMTITSRNFINKILINNFIIYQARIKIDFFFNYYIYSLFD